MNIVLVHGFISTGKIFFFIKKKLEAQGHKCFAPTLKPIDAKYGIEDLALKLNNYIPVSYTHLTLPTSDLV